MARRVGGPARLLVTCEHGGNRIPARYRELFKPARAMLRTHRGFDAGALELARRISRACGAPLEWSDVSRLLVDLNRSLDNPTVFSPLTAGLGRRERDRIVREHHRPYRARVRRRLGRLISGNGAVVHLSVHTFTPVLRDKVRRADIGLLFDPARPAEREFCTRWRRALRRDSPELTVLMNSPYRGTSDGLTTALRRGSPDGRYVGIELEVNQKHVRRAGAHWRNVQAAIVRTLLVTVAP